MSGPEPSDLDRILDEIAGAATGSEVRLGDLLTRLGARGFGPLLMLFSGFLLLPLGMVPGLPALVGLIYIALALQLFVGRRVPWLPAPLRNRAIDTERLHAGLDRARPHVRRLSKVVRPRATALASGPVALRLVAVGLFLAGAVVVPIGFIPFLPLMVSLPVMAFGIGLTARDGLVTALGYLLFVLPAVMLV